MIREAFRDLRHELPVADYVILPVPGSEPDVEGLKRSIAMLAEQAGKRWDKRAGSRSERGRQREEKGGAVE